MLFNLTCMNQKPVFKQVVIRKLKIPDENTDGNSINYSFQFFSSFILENHTLVWCCPLTTCGRFSVSVSDSLVGIRGHDVCSLTSYAYSDAEARCVLSKSILWYLQAEQLVYYMNKTLPCTVICQLRHRCFSMSLFIPLETLKETNRIYHIFITNSEPEDRGGGAVGRELVPQVKGWGLESQPRQISVVKKVVAAPLLNARQ